ncbi:MAG TPA: cytochrome P450 [Acidimicrobiales bacterium]|nr:cytochrome P450 [Acidimicrobiales bacterium]
MADHLTRDDIDLVSGEFWGRNPHAELAWMRAHTPVYWDGGVWGVTRYADVKQVSGDPATFSNAGGIRPESGPIAMMIDMDDPEHARRRKLVNRGYLPRRVRAREDEVRGACDVIIDRLADRDTCDLVWDIAAPLPLAVIANDLGFAEADRPQLLEWSDAMLRALTGDPDVAAAAGEAFGGYMAYATDVIAQRRADPTDDLMSVLCHAEVDGEQLTDDEIIHESLLILIGGDETTRHVISGGAYQLLVERDRWDHLRADESLLSTAVEEMLRWVSPIKNMARTATRDVELGGQLIREGDTLLLLYPSANRDDAVFADPNTFDIGRTPNEHVAFGFGTHFCLGSSLARLELRVMFEQLPARLPELSLVTDDEPAYRPANFISGYETLPVRLR